MIALHRFGMLAAAGALAAAPFAAGHDIEFRFVIDVAQEQPAPLIPAGFEPAGTGIARLDLDTGELKWEIEYAGLSGDIVAPGAHFHGPAGFGETARIQIDIAGDTGGTGAGAPLPQPPAGRLTGSAMLTGEQTADLLLGLWYVNIHTAMNPAGEIRGQALRTERCYAECDGDGVLTLFDFLCFQNAFATGAPYADCDGSGALDIFDFLCFQNAFSDNDC